MTFLASNSSSFLYSFSLWEALSLQNETRCKRCAVSIRKDKHSTADKVTSGCHHYIPNSLGHVPRKQLISSHYFLQLQNQLKNVFSRSYSHGSREVSLSLYPSHYESRFTPKCQYSTVQYHTPYTHRHGRSSAPCRDAASAVIVPGA